MQAASAEMAVTLCTFEAVPHVDTNEVTVRWVTQSVVGATGFNLWRSTDGQRETAELLTKELLPVAAGGQQVQTDASNQPAAYKFAYTDSTLPKSDTPSGTYIYWLQAVDADGNTLDVAFTALQPIMHQQFLPFMAK